MSIFFLLAAAITPAEAQVSLDEAAACHDLYLARYGSVDENAETIVKAIRAACTVDEGDALRDSVEAMRKRLPTASREQIETTIRRSLDEAWDGYLLKAVFEMRIGS